MGIYYTKSGRCDIVSVPSGDFLFFNNAFPFICCALCVSVPSGDFLFFNEIVVNEENQKQFPSPPGTSYFLIKSVANHTQKGDNVSVPSGDFLFFNNTNRNSTFA